MTFKYLQNNINIIHYTFPTFFKNKIGKTKKVQTNKRKNKKTKKQLQRY